MTNDHEIYFERRGAAGLITLNRPAALNALTHGMVLAMREKLEAWATDPDVAAVVVRGAGERAFCAGGDIRAIASSGSAGTALRARFLARRIYLECDDQALSQALYRVDPRHRDGRGRWCIRTRTISRGGETTLFAMPETGIGFFPDVGGSYFLPRCPGEIGMYLALTGARLKAGRNALCGYCDPHGDANRLGQIHRRACGREPRTRRTCWRSIARQRPKWRRRSRSFARSSTGYLPAEFRRGNSGGAGWRRRRLAAHDRRHDPQQIADLAETDIPADARGQGAFLW